MNSAVERIIAIANAEIGYLEKQSNSQLDDKRANAGYGNYTKYARELYNARYISWNPNGQAWCVVFVAWLFYTLCEQDVKKALRLGCQRSGNALCSTSMKGYKSAGRFYKMPQPGDQIFFYEGSGPGLAHTGFVYKVDSSKVYTIEGNTSGARGVVSNGGGVFKKSYSLNSYKIAGYGRPRYEEVAPSISDNFFSIYLHSSYATKATIAIDIVEEIEEDVTCNWSYMLTDLITNKSETKELRSIDKELTLFNLVPHTLYKVTLVATFTYEQQEQHLIFATPQERPEAVKNLTAAFGNNGLSNRECKLSFSVSDTTWGTYNKTATTKGYRVSLIINGKVVSFNDSLIRYTSATNIEKTFIFANIAKDNLDDFDYSNSSIQVGVQTWIKDTRGNLILNSEYPTCSDVLCLKPVIPMVDKIYINVLNKFNRAILSIINNNN